MIRRAYLDYQASTPVDPRVITSMTPYFHESPGNPHSSSHAFGWDAAAAVESASAQLAKALGTDADELVFTSGATEANNLAIIGSALRAPPLRRRILVSTIEHRSVLAAAEATTKRLGFQVDYVPVDREGTVRLDELERRLSEDVLLVSIMTVNNEVGATQPLKQALRLSKKVGALFHTDASQGLTAMALDFAELEVDFASLSAHKIYGPKGIGALFARRSQQSRLEPLFYGGGQQKGLRPGTVPVSLVVGFGAAAELLTGDCADSERARVRELRDGFIASLRREVPSLQVNGPTGMGRHPGNANISFPEVDSDALLGMIQPTVAASTGSACNAGTIEPSHVLLALGLNEDAANSSVRFSIGRFTTNEDLDYACKTVARAVKSLRG